MEFRMDVNRLLVDELSYELLIRGASPLGTAHEKRAALRDCLRLEKDGVLLSSELSLLPASELTACDRKINDLETAINSFGTDNYQNEYARMGTRLTHVSRRLARVQPTSEQETLKWHSLQDKCHQVSTDLRSKFAQKASEVLSMEQERSTNAPEDSESDGEPEATSSPTAPRTAPDMDARLAIALETLSLSLAESRRVRDEPTKLELYKWKTTYRGGPGLSNFLERIDELSTARGVTKAQLFKGALDLFEGDALIWYRSKKHTVRNWSELVGALRETFLPADYDFHLWSEIRSRTQGHAEKTAVFIASMEGLFGRLSQPPMEGERVQHIRRNLLPQLQQGLGLCTFQNVAQLDRTCAQLEDVYASVSGYRAPPPASQSMEPDLAYRGVGFPSLAPIAESANAPSRPTQPSRAPMKCWNCGQDGHRAVECSEPPRLHCRRCGQADTNTTNCSRCSGNGRRRQ